RSLLKTAPSTALSLTPLLHLECESARFNIGCQCKNRAQALTPDVASLHIHPQSLCFDKQYRHRTYS
ncbi:hypothetical protein, partial [Caballeronia sordidicola]|uniref:hypothetical protein n=1 Tax=Caballeronia sordidicola TaxID=196367 RepID=UPI001ABFC9E3